MPVFLKSACPEVQYRVDGTSSISSVLLFLSSTLYECNSLLAIIKPNRNEHIAFVPARSEASAVEMLQLLLLPMLLMGLAVKMVKKFKLYQFDQVI